MKATDFSLKDQSGKSHSLSDYRGQWIILLGISSDLVFSHQKFAAKYQLNFPILSDEKKEVIKAYGAWGKKKFKR